MFNLFGRILRNRLSKWRAIRQFVAMVYCLLDPNTPKLIKAVMAIVLLYVIFPFDVLPDIIPVMGLLDDAGVLAGMLLVLRRAVKEEHWRKADVLLFQRQD